MFSLQAKIQIKRISSILAKKKNGQRRHVSNKSNTTGVTSGAGTAYPSGAPVFTPGS